MQTAATVSRCKHFFLKVRCTPCYCFIACLSLLIKNKVLVFTEFTCEPHRHYQTGQSMASPNPSDHLITFTVHYIFSLYFKSVSSSLLNQGQVCCSINISMSHKSKYYLYKKSIHLLSSSTISCKPLQNHCSVISVGIFQ